MLRPVFDASDGIDGKVSIEVDPRNAKDTRKTIAEARALWWLVDRPNVYIKIPATLEGLPAITACLAEGICINVTLIFSLQRYEQVMDAFMAGLEAASDTDVARLTSVASFFVSRVDTEVDKRLDAIGTPEAKALRGKAAVANARLAYELFEQHHSTPRWQALAARGARVQRPLWASTSTKDPSYKDTLYVDDLVAPHTVNTMPEATLHATADHGTIVPQRHRRHLRRRAGRLQRPGEAWASATTTWSTSWSARASRSSPTPGPACARPSASSSKAASDWPLELSQAADRRQPAPRSARPADSTGCRAERARHVRRHR